MKLVALIAAVGFALLAFDPVFAGDPEEWCEYVHRTPEPAVLLYNRIPKAGSTTMQAIIKRQQKDKKLFDYVPTTVGYWGEEYHDQARKNSLYRFVNSRKSKISRKHTLIDGHIRYFDFEATSISSRSNDVVEYMQLIRQCPDRAASNYYYKIYDCADASAAKRKKAYEKYKIGLFGTEDIYACKRNDSCLTNTPVFGNTGTKIIAAYMAGSSCSEACRRADGGAAGVVRGHIAATSGKYVTFGAIERLNDYLEMLECVYPTYFGGAYQRFVDKPVHAKKSHTDELKDHMKVLFAEKCRNSSDTELYPELMAVFQGRFDIMKRRGAACCRSKAA